MSVLPKFALLLLAAAASCGRVGVVLLREPPAYGDPDAGVAADGGAPPAAVDAGPQPAGARAQGGSGAAGAGGHGGAGAGGRGGASAGGNGGAGAGAPAAVGGMGGMGGALAGAGGATAPACGGQPLFGMCWYLAAGSTSCNDACAAHGGFDSRALMYVGTTRQGGSVEDCSQILNALGYADPAAAAVRSDGWGFGCHVWPDGGLFWLDDPSAPFDPDTASPASTPVRIVCACLR